MRRCAVFLLCLGAAAAAEAQEIQGVYAGLTFGSFSYEDSGENLGLPMSDSTSGYRVVGGYQFNSVYAVEVGWGATGDFKERFDGFDPAVGEVSLEIRGDYEIATLRFLAFAPFSSVAIFGGAGYYDAKLAASFAYRSAVETATGTAEDADDGLTIVGGVQYELDRFAIRGEYEWLDTGDGVDAQSLNVSAILRF